MIISSAHSELLAWAWRSLKPLNADCDIAADQKNARETNGAEKAAATPAKLKPRKTNGEGVRPKPQRAPRESAAKHDQTLLALMRANPGATVTEIIRMNGRPRNSTMLSLERLEKAGLVEHARRGKWTVVDPDLLDPRTPGSGGKPAGWIEPLSGGRVARHAADGRVRDELTMAGA